jgi:hypothetical protein
MRKFSLLYIFLALSYYSLSQPNTPTASAYEGKQFMIGYMQNEIEGYEAFPILQAFITSKYTAIIQVKDQYNFSEFYTIKPDSILIVNLPEYNETTVYETPFGNGIEITSDNPISVWGYNSKRLTTDAFAAIPVASFGTEYVCMSMPNDQYIVPPYSLPDDSLYYATPRSSEFMIVAASNGTTIEFQPKAVTRGGKQVYNKYNVTLNKGQVYLVQSFLAERGLADLSGTIVTGTKPFGFFSGHVRTSNPQTTATDSKNHLVEMLLPTNIWGNEYITAPFGFNTTGDLIKITNIMPKTTIYCEYKGGFKTYFLDNPGDVLSVPNFKVPAKWNSDKPIQLGQLMMHNSSYADTAKYDPSLVVLPATNTFTNYAVFLCPFNPKWNSSQFDGHYICVVAEGKALTNLTIDNKYVASMSNIISQQIENTSYYWARIELFPGTHTIKCDSGSFSGIVFGRGQADAYSYILASALKNPFGNDTVPPIVNINENCGKLLYGITEYSNKNSSGLKLPLVITDQTKNYKWEMETILNNEFRIKAEPIDILKDGTFVVDIRDKNGNGKKYVYEYSALQIEIDNDIDFGEINSNDSSTVFYKIYNSGSDTIFVTSLTFSDPRLKIKATNFPFFIYPKDTAKIVICFVPNDNFDSLNAKATLTLECGELFFKLKSTVYKNSLKAEGWNFGNIIVGDSACSKIFVTNQGSGAIKLLSLDIPPDIKVFKLDTAGIFPYTLKPGDTLFIKVCFKPDSNIYFQHIVSFKNSLYINADALLTGSGIAPDINSIVIDFFKRRVGTTNDSTITFKNSGNTDGLLKFNSITTFDSDFNTNEISSLNQTIIAQDSLKINISYLPSTSKNNLYEAKLETNWQYHKPITVTLKGEGTLPVVKFSDFDFGKVHINTTVQKSALILTTSGNEDLTIDSIYFNSGDYQEFFIDYSLLKNIKLSPKTLYEIPISFKPTTKGKFAIKLNIIHDANPNYGRSIDIVNINGEGVITNYQSNLIIDNDFRVCNNNTGIFSLKNTGDVDFMLDSANILISGCDFTATPSKSLPAILTPNSEYQSKIQFFNVTRSDINVKINSVINDTILNKIENSYSPIQNKISINQLEKLEFTPGDSLNINISGRFNEKTDDGFNFYLKLEVTQKLLYLLNNDLILKYGKNGENSIKCIAIQDLDSIIIYSKEKLFSENKNIIWSIEIPFLVLLNEVKQMAINIKIAENECFEKDNSDVATELLDVCVFNVRNVKLIPEQARYSIKVMQNEGILIVNADLSAEETVNFNILDLNGKKILEKSKYSLHKGNQSVIFEINNFASGVYLVSIDSPQYIYKKMIVLNK